MLGSEADGAGSGFSAEYNEFVPLALEAVHESRNAEHVAQPDASVVGALQRMGYAVSEDEGRRISPLAQDGVEGLHSEVAIHLYPETQLSLREFVGYDAKFTALTIGTESPNKVTIYFVGGAQARLGSFLLGIQPRRRSPNKIEGRRCDTYDEATGTCSHERPHD